MEKRENGYSRGEFEEFLKNEVLHSFDEKGPYSTGVHKYSSISVIRRGIIYEIIGGVIISIPGLLILYYLPWTEIEKSLFLFVLSLPFSLLPGYMTFDRALIANKRISLYVNLENFYVNKDYISGKKLVLEDLMNNDIKTNGINPNTLMYIHEHISDIISGHTLAMSNYVYLQKNLKHIKNQDEQVKYMIEIELKWIINYSQEFTLLVQSWISHHATELAELEKQIQSQELTTESDGGKTALELSRISLHEHLKELEKVRV